MVTVEIMKNRPGLKVVLLRNHGLVAVGSTLNHAFKMAYNVEFGLQCYYQAMQLGTPEPVTDEQLAEIRAVYHP